MVLSFKTAKKIKSSEEHNKYYSYDSGIPGTYVPNMSEEDKLKFKAKHIKGSDERIEIRVSLWSNVVITVFKNPKNGNNIPSDKKHEIIKISANGQIHMSLDDYNNLQTAISEAKEILNNE